MTEKKPPRWTVGTWANVPRYACTECHFDTLDRGEMVRHAQRKHPRLWEAGGAELVTEDGPLAGVDFASDEAGEAAARAGLSRKHFKGRTPSGKSGFTVADVRVAAASATQEA